MMFFIGSIAGFFNGFFTCGAGQIIIFYLIFIKKYDSHISRGTSVAILSITSIVSLIFHLIILKIVIVVMLSLLFGILGANIMKKINSKKLNLISGILMTVMVLINLCR